MTYWNPTGEKDGWCVSLGRTSRNVDRWKEVRSSEEQWGAPTDSFCHSIRCVSIWQVFHFFFFFCRMQVISFLRSPLLASLHPHPPQTHTHAHTHPVVKGHAGKMKPNRGEKWNIDFFFSPFFFFCPSPTPDGFCFSRIIFPFLLSATSSSLRSATLWAPAHSPTEMNSNAKRSDWVGFCLFPQNHAPADLYQMTKNPDTSPSSPDGLEIEFRSGLSPVDCELPADVSILIGLIFFFQLSMLKPWEPNASFFGGQIFRVSVHLQCL